MIYSFTQVLCDILKTGGLPGKEKGHQPPLYFASDDLEYQVSRSLRILFLIKYY